MSVVSNSTIGNLLIVTAISTSSVCLDKVNNQNDMNLTEKGRYKQVEELFCVETSSSSNKTYSSIDDLANLNVVLEFSEKIINNTIDIDSEFVDIVNDNFWDLI